MELLVNVAFKFFNPCTAMVVMVTNISILLPRPLASLVPRPHPLTRRNGLVNQVEFLGLAGTLATV